MNSLTTTNQVGSSQQQPTNIGHRHSDLLIVSLLLLILLHIFYLTISNEQMRILETTDSSCRSHHYYHRHHQCSITLVTIPLFYDGPISLNAMFFFTSSFPFVHVVKTCVLLLFTALFLAFLSLSRWAYENYKRHSQ